MDNKKFSQANILGVKVDKVTMNQAVELVENWLRGQGKHYIVTPNPEFIMAAQKDEEFRRVLNQADLAIPDGAGLKLATDLESTIPGVDLMEELIRVATKKGFTTGFLGGRDGVAEKTADCLRKKYPGLKIGYISSGGIIDKNGNSHNTKYVIPNTDLLFVAFGQVKQEKWIAKNLPKIPVKVAMGVGGSFAYLSGEVTRAPKWMRNLGLEWLFRLILQPWRIKRQFALVKFAWKVVLG
ncbi:WecB/TagA/CpsF family glycosyltransferase [Candidatus Daviesbacteria bacterium]|nr:WecB/TagA/CpsF family glycosyltransferase [Candidatus Daviesbacteria bacterium]